MLLLAIKMPRMTETLRFVIRGGDKNDKRSFLRAQASIAYNHAVYSNEGGELLIADQEETAAHAFPH